MPIIGAFMVPHPPIILPEVGGGEEKKIQTVTDAYRKTAEMIRDLAPDTIILSSPHHVMYADYFNFQAGTHMRGDMGQFGAPQVSFSVELDEELVNTVSRLADRNSFPAGTLGQHDRVLDHGTMIPLYFIDQVYSDYKLVLLGLSGLPLADHYRLGQYLQQSAQALGRRAVYIGSGDLSHRLKEEGPYGFNTRGPEYDTRIMDVMGSGRFGELLEFDDVLCEQAAECGHRSFVLMAGALDGYSVTAERLCHEDTFGVGYGICTFLPDGPDEDRHFLQQWEEREAARRAEQRAGEDVYVRLARKALETYITDGDRIDVPEDLPAELTERRAGAFVSLHEEGKLRGCIGTISATEPTLASEIINNAISAATADPRFMPVRVGELDRLEYSVDILGEAEPVSSLEELDPSCYGVIVTKGSRRGLLLPDLDGVDTAEQQVRIACQKAGIDPKERGIRLERFQVIRHY